MLLVLVRCSVPPEIKNKYIENIFPSQKYQIKKMKFVIE
jgi:hypothetical protein